MHFKVGSVRKVYMQPQCDKALSLKRVLEDKRCDLVQICSTILICFNIQQDPEERGEEEDTKTENYLPDKPHEVEELPQDAENSGKSAEDTENIQATESMATEEAGKSDSKNSEEVNLKSFCLKIILTK